MKLFVEKKLENFNPETYTASPEIVYTTSDDGFKLRATVTSSNTGVFTFSDLIPCEIGEQCIVKADYNIISGIGFTKHIQIYHNGVLQGDLVESSQVSFTRVTNEIEIRFVVDGSYIIDLYNLSLTKVGLSEIDLVENEDIRLTKQIKDFGNIGDVKAGFSNNITIQFSDKNNINVGFFSNISSENILKLINGIKAIITTDEGDILADGIVTIKNIERYNETFFCNLFFTSFDTSFFKKLSEENVEVPHIYINNTWQSKVDNMNRTMDTFELNNEKYVFGLVNNDNKYEYETAGNQFNLNMGVYIYEIQEIDKSSLSSQKNIQNNSVPWSHGYSAVPSDLEPFIRLKYLMNEIHQKYGYTMEGTIFNDPKVYNLVTNPILKEIEPAEIINEIKFSDYLEWTCGYDRHTSKFLKVVTTDTTNYDVIHTNLGVDSYCKFDVNDSDKNNYEDLYGNVLVGHTPWYLNGLDWRKNFTTKDMKVRVKVKINHNNGISGYFRLIIADGFYNANGNYAQMNPYSWMITEDIYLNANSSNADYVYFEKDIVIKDFQGFKGDGDGDAYFIRVNMVNDIVCTTANPIHVEVDATYSEIRPTENIEMGNSYYMDDKYSLTYSEQDLMKDFINKFNLIPQVNTLENKVTYYTYDEFYSLDEELNWEKKILRDKKIIYDYSMKDAKSTYYFQNNCKASNIDLEKYDLESKYGQYELKTLFTNKSTYKIENKIENIFFDTEPDKLEPFGIYDKTDEGVGGFPLICSTDTAIKDQTIYCGDGVDLEEDRVSYKRTKQTKSLIGYAKKYRSKSQRINGYEMNAIPLTYKNRSPWYLLKYNDWNVTDKPQSYYVRYLSPFNEISSGFFLDDNVDLTLNNSNQQPIYNSLTFEDIPKFNISKNLYSEYESEMINILNTNTHSLEAFFMLSETEYRELTLREKIFLDGNRYIIKKIDSFRPKEPVKITLMTYQFQQGIKQVHKADGYNTTIWTASSIPDIGWYSWGESSSEYQIGLTTMNHKPGQRYRIKLTLKSTDGGWVKGIYRNGSTSDLQSENDYIHPGAILNYYFEYDRTDTAISTPTSYVSESFKFQGSSSSTRFTIYGIEVYEI